MRVEPVPATGTRSTPGNDGSKDKAFQLGVGYTLGDIYVFGVWEQIKYDLDGVAAATRTGSATPTRSA